MKFSEGLHQPTKWFAGVFVKLQKIQTAQDGQYENLFDNWADSTSLNLLLLKSSVARLLNSYE